MNFEGVIREIDIHSFLLFNDVSISSLLDEEMKLVSSYAEVRKQSFANGRHVARRALLELGVKNFPLLINTSNKAPSWPEQVRGSISHCDGAAVAIVASSDDYLNLGIDIEQHHRCRRELWSNIFIEDEINYLESLAINEQVKFATLMFSAKESYFKLLNPLLNKWIGFSDAKIVLDEDAMIFRVLPQKEFLVPMHEREVLGRYCIIDGYVLTYLYIKK